MQDVYGTYGDPPQKKKSHFFGDTEGLCLPTGNGFDLLRVLFHKQSQQEGSKSQNCSMLLLAGNSSNLSGSSRFRFFNYVLLNIS